MGVSLLCGFGFAGKDYVYKQFETAEPVAGVLVKDASAYVTIRTADTDHITVRYAELPEGEPLYDISVQNGRLVVESREDIDVDTTDGGGFALVRVSVEGHSVSGPKRELTITLPDKQYDQPEAGDGRRHCHRQCDRQCQAGGRPGQVVQRGRLHHENRRPGPKAQINSRPPTMWPGAVDNPAGPGYNRHRKGRRRTNGGSPVLQEVTASWGA